VAAVLGAVPVATHASAFDDGAAYEHALGPAHRFYLRNKVMHLRRLLKRYAPDARRLLDLGCGTGQVEEFLADGAYEITGVDLSEAMVSHASAKNLPRTEFLAADAARTGLPASSFDVAFATALFHHVPPPHHAEVAQEMARVVKPGGLVVVFEHNPANPVTRRMVRRTPIDADAVLLGPQELGDALKTAGLRPVATRFLTFFPAALAAFARLEAAMGWLPLGGQFMMVARSPVAASVDPNAAGRADVD
jgi:SAM-dependent methyltransferase